MIKITIPGNPIGKQVARTVRIKNFIRSFDPQEKEKLRVREECKQYILNGLGIYRPELIDVKRTEIQMEAYFLRSNVNFSISHVSPSLFVA
jgi:hypothetical protein